MVLLDVMALLPPHLGDKLIDWDLLAKAGGMDLLIGKDVLEFGPSYGIDLYMFAPYARSYTMIESAPDVLDHLQPLTRLLNDRDAAALVIVRNLRQPLDAFAGKNYDLVIDFGTVDNVLAGVKPYEEAMRLLRPGGVLLTTYANRKVLGTEFSECGDEVRFDPGGLASWFTGLGDPFVRIHEDQPRAGMAVRRGK